MPIALLHALLLQQNFYGRNAFTKTNFWTLTDLALAANAFKQIMWRSGSINGMKKMLSKVLGDSFD